MQSQKISEKTRGIAGNRGPNAGQGPTTKQHAIEILEHIHTPSYMINTQVAYVVDLSEWIPTIQQ